MGLGKQAKVLTKHQQAAMLSFLETTRHRQRNKVIFLLSVSQEDLAEAIDKSVDTVSNIERGKFSPRLDTSLDIANALDVEPFELFQVRELPLKDKEKARILDEIFDLLKDESDEVLQFTLAQAKQLISLREQFIQKMKK